LQGPLPQIRKSQKPGTGYGHRNLNFQSHTIWTCGCRPCDTISMFPGQRQREHLLFLYIQSRLKSLKWKGQLERIVVLTRNSLLAGLAVTAGLSMMLWERSAHAQKLPGAVSLLKDTSVKPGEEPRGAQGQSTVMVALGGRELRPISTTQRVYPLAQSRARAIRF